mgnify:CR=1 FL=1
MNSETKRTCRFCSEAIPLAAKVCPRCRQWLTLRSLRNPGVWTLVFGTVLMGFFASLASKTMAHLESIINPRPLYSEMPDALRVLSAQMVWVEGTNGGTIFVVGILTNQSSVTWKSPELQCRFFNAGGGMIDAAYPSSRLTILPGGDAAFRGTVVPACAKSEYHTLTVKVSSASNARSAF